MITRSDLTAGQQAVQAGHAALLYAAGHPGDWHEGALIILAVRDNVQLYDLADRLDLQGHQLAVFREPDMDWRLTAIAAGPAAGRMLRHVPLAFSEPGGGEMNGCEGHENSGASP